MKRPILRWNLLLCSLTVASYGVAGEAKPPDPKGPKNPANTAAVAQPPNWKFDSPISVPQGVAGSQQTEVNAATDRSGRVHVIWIEDANKKRTLYYAQLDPKTKEFTTPVKVREPRGNLRTGAQVSVDDSGAGAVFALWSETSSGASQDSEIWLALSSDGGKTFSAAQVSDNPKPGSSRQFPALVIDRGRACLAYVENLGGNKGVQLQLRLSLNGGRDFDKSVTLVSSVNECLPTIAVSNKYVIVLYRLGQGQMQNDIALRASADGGSNFSGNNMGAMRVSIDNWRFNRPADSGPQAVLDKKDQLHVVWHSNGDAYYSHSFFKDGGTHFTPKKVITAPKTGPQTLPAIALDAEDHILVAWQSTNDRERRTRIRLKQSNDEGNTFSASLDVPLVTATANQSFGPEPCLLVAADNSLWLAWTETDPSAKQQKAHLARAAKSAPVAPASPPPGPS